MNVAEALKRIEDLAAVVREFANDSATANEGVSPIALEGAGNACAEIQELAHDVRKSMPAGALDADVHRSNDDWPD
jgi:hypothetical protein